MIDGRYRIKHIIGEGASGTVYRAVDCKDGREVAVKVHSGGRDGFDHECRILGMLEHEHIVRLHSQERGHGMLVLELCDYNLISFMNEHELDMRCIKRIVRMILLALRHMHGKGVIHRDIKLGNILVKGDSVKLCDFGLSCLKAQNDFGYCGTRDYLAPEMMLPGDKVFYDEKIDVFAAGVVFKTLVMRRKGADLDVERMGADAVDLLQSMMEPDPERRYSAEQALRHRVFDEIFPEVPDFRTIRSFFKTTKHGIVGRDRNYIRIQYQKEMRIEALESMDFSTGTTESIRNEQENRANVGGTQCRCMTIPRYRASIDGMHANERFLTETELKHYVFLCSYFRILAERTVKVQIEDGGHVFAVNANNARILEHRDYKVVKSIRGRWSFLGKLASGRDEVPYEIRAVFDRLEKKAMRMPHRCFFHYGGLDLCSSMSLPTLNEPLVKEYVFAKDVGWCIKTRLRFTILMSDGTRFDLCADEHVMIAGQKRVPICKEMPKHCRDLLRVSRVLLLKFM